MTPLLSLYLFFPLLLLQGFFCGSEMAIVSCNRSKLRVRSERGSRAARLVLKLLENPERLFTITLIGANVCSIANTSLMTWYFMSTGPHLFGVEGMVLLLVWPALVLFGEVVPKSIYQHYANGISLAAAPVLYAVGVLMMPLLAILHSYTQLLTRIIHKAKRPLFGATREELKRMIQKSSTGTDVKMEERALVSKMLDFGAHELKEAIVPLIQVQGVEASKTIREAMDYFVEVEHSRLPVYDERVDKMIGILHSFDILSVENPESTVREHMREALFVPPTQALDELFGRMRSEGHSMAIVVNEYGGAEGIVTVEDIVESVVGNISDEFDEEEQLIHQVGKTVYEMSGRATIEQFNEVSPVKIPEGEYDTLAGFLLSEFNRVPQKFEYLNFNGLQFTILNATERSIESVHVRIIQKSTP